MFWISAKQNVLFYSVSRTTWACTNSCWRYRLSAAVLTDLKVGHNGKASYGLRTSADVSEEKASTSILRCAMCVKLNSEKPKR